MILHNAVMSKFTHCNLSEPYGKLLFCRGINIFNEGFYIFQEALGGGDYSRQMSIQGNTVYWINNSYFYYKLKYTV